MKKGVKFHVHNGKKMVPLTLRPRLFTNSTTTDKMIIMSNEVIVAGTDLLYKDALASGEIIKVLPDYWFNHNFESFYLVSDGNKHRRKIVREFIDFITDIFEKLNE